MDIAFFHDHIISKKGNNLYSTGGINTKVINRYKNISDNLTLVTREDSSRTIKGLTRIASLDDISYVSAPNLASFSINNHSTAYKKISKVIENNDFLIVRLPSLIGYLALYINQKYKKKYIIELVGCPWDSYRYYGNIKGALLAGPLYFLTKYFIKKSKNTLYVTSDFLQKRYPNKEINQINCSDVEIDVNDDILKNRLLHINNGDSTTIKLGMIGSLTSKYKGFDIAIKALKELAKQSSNRYILEIVGGGDKDKIVKLIKEHGVLENVRIIGVLPHPHGIFQWLDTIDIYLHPSRVEGLPRSLIEAMGRACTCIGTNIGGIPELLDSTVLIKKDDYKHLNKMIISLTNKQKRIKQSIRNFNEAKKYNKKDLDKRRSDFYNRCISQIN